jgi:UDP-glucose 4-epimerase
MVGAVTTVLVTGGAGFIGSNLADRLLAEEHRVVAVDDLSTGRIANLAEARGYGKAYTFFNMDVRAEGLLPLFERHRPEIVFHLAAQAGVRPSLEDPVHDASVNIMGTLNVLSCAQAVGARKVIYAASGGTLYGEPKRIPSKESAAPASRPLSPYGVSKKVVLDYLAYFQRYRGLDYTALALANVYGPRQDPTGEAGVIAVFAAAMLEGRSPTIYGDGNQTRDYVFVDDVVHAFAQAMDRGSGRVANVGTGLETSVNGLYRLLADIIGFAGEPEHGPLPPGELRRSALDIGSAASAIAWKPWTHLEDGLAETVAYLKGV